MWLTTQRLFNTELGINAPGSALIWGSAVGAVRLKLGG